MVGFLFGTVCLIALLKVLRHRRTWGGEWGGHHCYAARRSWRGTSRGWRGGSRWIMLRALFERLETTPGQERVIVQALDRLAENRGAVRDEMKQTRVDVARAIEGGLIDDAALDDAFARHDRLLAELRVSLIEALKTGVETLDEGQRKELARLFSGGSVLGGGPPPWEHPYRAWA